MQVLIIGASGFIGQYLVRRLNKTMSHGVVGTFLSRYPSDDGNSWHRVELTDAAGLEQVFRLAQPEVVVHLAAIADVTMAARDPERATAVNVAATSSIARLCAFHEAKLIFVSTEYVFDGERGYYREDDAPRPITHYGKTKWQAEQEVAKLASHWNILRTSIVYGWPGPGKRNFAPWLIERLRNGQPYHGPTDVHRTPIYVEHLVDGIEKLVEGHYSGIHHVAGRDLVSMYDFARTIAEVFHLDDGLVVPVDPATGGLPGTNAQEPVAGSSIPDLMGLDCARTMRLIGLDHPGLIEGTAAMQARGGF